MDKPMGGDKDQRKLLGKRGEDIGAAWLEAKGMRILMRNYRCRIGEIDIIGQMEGAIVIVEVRSRSSDLWGTPAESVNERKKKKLRQVAAYYLYQYGKEDSACRFDVVRILFGQPDSAARVEWFPNAF